MALFDTILVANRGEIACRVIESARAMGVRSVAVYSDADAGARHVALADEAVHIGGAAPSESYLRTEAILAALRGEIPEHVYNVDVIPRWLERFGGKALI